MSEKTDIACALLQARPTRYAARGTHTRFDASTLARDVNDILEALHPLKVVTLCGHGTCGMPVYEDGFCKAHGPKAPEVTNKPKLVRYEYQCKFVHSTILEFPEGTQPQEVDCEAVTRAQDYVPCDKTAALVGPLDG